MSSAVCASPLEITDGNLTRAVISSVENAMSMCSIESKCVGLSSIPPRETGIVTGLIGVHGKVSGFVTVNLAERVALKAVGGLLGESYTQLTPQVVDGTGEITNIITGGIKSLLTGSTWAFSHITIPTVILGQGYQIAYAKGLDFFNATFEINDENSLMLADRLMNVSISLLRL
jgi:chemotaxis protein CheX